MIYKHFNPTTISDDCSGMLEISDVFRPIPELKKPNTSIKTRDKYSKICGQIQYLEVK